MQQVMRWTRAIVALALVAIASPAIVAQESGKLKVTVDYTGTGTVDATHEIFVWVFDNPNIGADSVPIASDVATANGGRAEFQRPAQGGVPGSSLRREGRLRRHVGPAALRARPSPSTATWAWPRRYRPAAPTPPSTVTFDATVRMP